MRKKIVAGNWKMNMNLAEGVALAGSIKDYFQGKDDLKTQVVICPAFTHLSGLKDILKGSMVSIGAQNCASEPSGAYTGEVSCDMIKSAGSSFVIIGHSERRTYYNEDDSLLYKKTVLAIKSGLKVIFCCGEILPEREAGIHFQVVSRQLTDGLFSLSETDFETITIAYEPVWAIGTGLTATPAQAQEMHNYIRKIIREKYGNKIADLTPILYGGSCKPSNAAEIFSMADVDGGLIGGASLNKEDFCAIIEAM